MMLTDLHRYFGVELNYQKVWKRKELTMHDIHGPEDESYDKLRWYCSSIKETNPGSIVECEIDYSKDANEDLFTLAYSVVDAENDNNWGWFCFQLKDALLSHRMTGFDEFTFFSDRHPGILKAVHLVMKSYPLHNKKHWSSVFKKTAYAPSRKEFDEHINNIVVSMPLARQFIVSSCPESWANALFSGNQWGVINNNISKSWNNWVKAARHLPIVAMVDHIRLQIMDMMHRRREATMRMVKRLSPSKENVVAKTYVESRSLKVHKACGWSFEVVDGDKSFGVDLSARTCSCRAWQINRLPCKHACATIESKSLSLYDFCDKYFHIKLCREAYKGILNPILTFNMYDSNPEHPSTINAPDVRIQPGRRRTQRIPSQVQSRVSKCGLCHKRGHNQRSCNEAIN
ncbi:uncharacterized protein [Henckelia pumila]|uniref:uncharacterized protein n=1 Tax=Henckelia pumila TaxID=405737 RepID=UPI003C6E918A